MIQLSEATKINTTIPIVFQKIEQVDSDDTRFTRVKIWMLHTNENLNGSFFEKPVVIEAIPSLSNTPILGYIAVDSEGEKDFSDHREVLIIENGEAKTKYLGKAIGVIPSDNNAKFEMRVCDDGVEREFLTVEGLLWTGKFDDAAEIMLRDVIKNQSIEIDPKNYFGEFKEDKLFHFTKFRFYGACILGDKVRPAMQNATIELTYSVQDFEKEIQVRLEEYKNYMTKQEEKNKQSKEGNQMEGNKATQFSLTAIQLRDELHNALKPETFVDRWGERQSVYVYYDHKDDEVYAYDRADNYNLYGFKFAASGDKVTIDFTTKRRKKLDVVDYVEGEAVTPTFSAEVFTEITANAEKELEGKSTDTIFQLNKEIGELKGKLSGIEADKKKELFARYDCLADIEAFVNLESIAEKYSIDELVKEIKVIAFDNNVPFEKFSAHKQPETKDLIKTTFSKGETALASPYGDLFEEYLK